MFSTQKMGKNDYVVELKLLKYGLKNTMQIVGYQYHQKLLILFQTTFALRNVFMELNCHEMMTQAYHVVLVLATYN